MQMFPYRTGFVSTYLMETTSGERIPFILISTSLTNGVSFQMKEFASLQWKTFPPFRAKFFHIY